MVSLWNDYRFGACPRPKAGAGNHVWRFNAPVKGAVLLCGKLGFELRQTFGVFDRTQRIDQLVQFSFDNAV